jgi:hypothetical protein
MRGEKTTLHFLSLNLPIGFSETLCKKRFSRGLPTGHLELCGTFPWTPNEVIRLKTKTIWEESFLLTIFPHSCSQLPNNYKNQIFFGETRLIHKKLLPTLSARKSTLLAIAVPWKDHFTRLRSPANSRSIPRIGEAAKGE